MDAIKKLFIFQILVCMMTIASSVLACHSGGAMGVASADPLNSTIDYSFASTFVSGSTSGTLGCENWDFVKNNRVQYIHLSWNSLSEEVSQGKGQHLKALSQMYGCNGDYEHTFNSMLYGNYPHLFLEGEEIDPYERSHLLEYEINRLMNEYNIEDFCSLHS